jgi:hypothetical protein
VVGRTHGTAVRGKQPCGGLLPHPSRRSYRHPKRPPPKRWPRWMPSFPGSEERSGAAIGANASRRRCIRRAGRRHLRHSRSLFSDRRRARVPRFYLTANIRLIQPAFFRDRILSYGGIMTEHAARLIEGWQDGEVRDLHRDMMRVTLQIAARSLFNVDIGDDAGTIGQALAVVLDDMPKLAGLAFLPEWIPLWGFGRFRRALADWTRSSTASFASGSTPAW